MMCFASRHEIWENLLHSDESVLRALNKRICALKILGKVASFRTRKMVADGIFMSKMIYLITLWGGSAKYMIVTLQKAQNRAARVVTKLDWYTPTAELLNQCGWLSVHQLVVYHSVVLSRTSFSIPCFQLSTLIKLSRPGIYKAYKGFGLGIDSQ